MFIITGYLGFVEAINHSHKSIELPEDEQSKRRPSFRRSKALYGNPGHPLLTTSKHLDEDSLLEEGYPLVKDVQSGQVVTPQVLTRYSKNHPGDMSSLVGRKLDIRTGGTVLHVSIEEVDGDDLVKNDDDLVKKDKATSETAEGYRWWTWNADMHQLSIFLSVIYFISTGIFFIPATIWYPQDTITGSPSLGSIIFWQQVTQVSL